MKARLTALAIACALAAACSRPGDRGPDTAGSVSSVPAGPSLYDLQIPLTDQQGRDIPFDVHRGRPVLLAMFYATCPSACPRLIEELKGLESRLAPAARSRTRVLLVSMDPDRDTPDVLLQAAARHAVDGDRWTLARASEESVRELAAVLGVRYRAQMDGTIDHTSAIFLLDPHGAIVEKTQGLGQPTDAIERRLENP